MGSTCDEPYARIAVGCDGLHLNVHHAATPKTMRAREDAERLFAPARRLV